jgi:hypothetical protein
MVVLRNILGREGTRRGEGHGGRLSDAGREDDEKGRRLGPADETTQG